MEEVDRQKKMNFAPCFCSNCLVQEGNLLIDNLKSLNQDNFTNHILNRKTFEPRATTTGSLSNTTQPETKKTQQIPVKLSKDKIPILKIILTMACHRFIEETMGTGGVIIPRQIFGEKEVKAIVKNVNRICSIEDMERVIGGELIIGQTEVLFESLEGFIKKRDMTIPPIDVLTNCKRVLSNVTNRKVATRPVTVSVKKRKQCSREEAEARKLELAEQKRIKAEKKEAVKQMKARQKMRQLKIMEEVKERNGLPSCS